jgi:hypothetical protein
MVASNDSVGVSGKGGADTDMVSKSVMSRV